MRIARLLLGPLQGAAVLLDREGDKEDTAVLMSSNWSDLVVKLSELSRLVKLRGSLLKDLQTG